MDLTLVFKLKEGTAQPAGVAVAFDFNQWSAAELCAGARQRSTTATASAWLTAATVRVIPQSYLFNKGAPLLFSDSPRLSCTSGVPAKIEMLTGNASTPAMCFFSPSEEARLHPASRAEDPVWQLRDVH